jgi:hypothetical protein
MNKTEDYGNGDSSHQHRARTHPGSRAALIDLPGITEAYSVNGLYDLVAIVRVRDRSHVGHRERRADKIGVSQLRWTTESMR